MIYPVFVMVLSICMTEYINELIHFVDIVFH